MVTFDMHIHTSRHSPDSVINPFSLVRHAAELGLTGVVITEHDWLWTEQELDELRAATPEVQVYAGIEVSAAEGHFLCYGVTDPLRLPKGIHVKDLCREVHAQGGAVVAAHPYRWGQDFDSILIQEPLLDGLEIMSSNMDEPCRTKARACWSNHPTPWAALGNSDAHTLEKVAQCYTVFSEPIRDQMDLLEALRSGQMEARARYFT
jgi:predicted metal-dependent phosphoesterase TrpH